MPTPLIISAGELYEIRKARVVADRVKARVNLSPAQKVVILGSSSVEPSTLVLPQRYIGPSCLKDAGNADKKFS